MAALIASLSMPASSFFPLAPFPALPGSPGLYWSIFLLWWWMYTAEMRGENALLTRKCSDSSILTAQHGGCAKPSPGHHWLEIIIIGKAPVLQSRCIIYDQMIAHWLAEIIHSLRCFWVNERALTSLLSHPCSSEAIRSFLSAHGAAV